MAKADNKTQLTDASVEAFLTSVSDEQQRDDSLRVIEIMRRVTGEIPKMWGPAIIGFGLQHLKYESGREMDWMEIGFSPRKANITLYILSSSLDQSQHLEKLGKHKVSGSCLHIKRLADVDEKVFEKLISEFFQFIRNGGMVTNG